MSNEMIYGTFNEDQAGEVIEQLRRDGVPDTAIAVIGADRNQMLPVTSHLVDRERMHPFVAKAIAGGVILGFLSGLATFFIPTVAAMHIVGPIMAAIAGACAGAYIGMLFGTAVVFDNPVWTAAVYEGPVAAHEVKIGVRTDEQHRHEIEHLFEESGALEVDIGRAA
ncbi:MAG TPA: hypothetical protein V6D22_00315 [Candidatus Obscuribacterales bacterium]